MTSEINSLSQNLLSSTREPPNSSAVSRSRNGQAVAGPQALPGNRQPEVSRQEQSGKDREVNSKELEGTVSDLNELVQRMRRELQFSVEEDSGQTIVKVVDLETDEVIRQIPPEAVVELRKRLAETADAIFFKESV